MDREPEAPDEPWLVRPGTIRGIWVGSIAVLTLLVILDFFVPKTGTYFDIQGGIGFAAWYGFGICAGLVFVSKLLGMALKVRDDFYDD
ncbi:MAG: hypothetical protein AAF501_11560 [Pseudomonadota bacterium]